jgi:undecaprenyl phosphate-alpha-L-ara4N flippase subunit ArnE
MIGRVIKTSHRTAVGMFLMFTTSACICAGQLFWKFYGGGRGSGFLVAGLLLYGIGAFIMLTAYKFGNLSVLQPLLSLNYIATIILGRVFLQEEITPFKVAGTVCITIGVILIGSSHE